MASGLNTPYAHFQVLIVEAEIKDKFLRDEDTKEGFGIECEVSYNDCHRRFHRKTAAYENSLHARWYEEMFIIIDNVTEPNFIDYYGVRRHLSDVSVVVNALIPKKRYDDWLPLPDGCGRLKLVYTATEQGSLPPDYSSLSRKLDSFRLNVTEGNSVIIGGTIEGTIELMTPKVVVIDTIFIRLYGSERVGWSELDLDMNIRHSGITHLVNKWFHGWKNPKGILDPGYYCWKFRIRIPKNLPPSFYNGFSCIHYKLFAYVDEHKHSPAKLIEITSPVNQLDTRENHASKHRLDVFCKLDKGVYYVEEDPILLSIKFKLLNNSDHHIRKVKVIVEERHSYAAEDDVLNDTKILFKKSYLEDVIKGHSKHESDILLDLPPGHSTVSLASGIGVTRTFIQHVLIVKVIKSVPFHSKKVCIEIPFDVATKPHKEKRKRQVLALLHERMVSTPPSPAIPRRRLKDRAKVYSGGSDEIGEQNDISNKILKSIVPIRNSEPVDEKEPEVSSDDRNVMDSFSNVYNPFINNNTYNPFLDSTPLFPNSVPNSLVSHDVEVPVQSPLYSANPFLNK